MKKFDFNKMLRKENMIVLILVGILILVATIPVDGGAKDSKDEAKEEVLIGDSRKEDFSMENSDVDLVQNKDEQYIVSLENRVEELLNNMDGVGKVEVMITLKASREYVVEKDSPVTHKSVVEADAQGGNRNTSENQTDETTIYTTDAEGNKIPYVIKINEPEIQGITVVAQGGGNPTLKSEITSVLSALFSLDAHKIMVVKMK